MPGFDGTGPRSFGPMTGGGRGFCALPIQRGVPYPLPYSPVYARPFYGRPCLGWGFRRGRGGRGRRFWW